MNSNNSGSNSEVLKDKNSITKGDSIINPTIKRRKLFFYLAAGAASIYGLTKMPFNIFKSKVAQATRITVKENPYAVKRDPKRGVNNG